MSPTRHRQGVAKFLAPRWYRIAMMLGVAMATANAVVFARQLVSGDLGASNWMGLLFSILLGSYYGWCSVVSWSIPVVQMTAGRIELGHIGSRIRQSVQLDDLVGLRWQDSFDLRLCARSGAEHSVLLSQLARRDRRRLEAALRERIGSAGSAGTTRGAESRPC